MASLAASIGKRLDARTSRFDVALNPLGLGRVDVRLEIDAHGRTTAALSFDRPEAATLLQSHAGELRAALSQAGLDVSPDALSFDVAANAGGQGQAGQGQAGQGGSGQDAPGSGGRGAGLGAFSSAAAALDAAPGAYASARAARGYDIRI